MRRFRESASKFVDAIESSVASKRSTVSVGEEFNLGDYANEGGIVTHLQPIVDNCGVAHSLQYRAG
jgi:hypothetical protein